MDGVDDMRCKVAHDGGEFLDVGGLLFNTGRGREFVSYLPPEAHRRTHMANRKIDRRTERTRAALMSAFLELILSRGYEAVAIADIIRKANVGRSTFYLHYARK